MTDVRQRLTNCFRVVFPNLPEANIPKSTPGTVPAWDSLAAITLLQVVQEEFQVEIDLERLGELDSFQAMEDYLMVAAK